MLIFTLWNPEALTPWRAEMLLQLYLATSNLLTHSLDSNRCMPLPKNLF